MENWYIGQDIVCIRTHSKGFVTKDNVYTIKSLKQGCCGIYIDIGFTALDKASEYSTYCNRCNTISSNGSSPILWFHEGLFVPLNSLVNISEIEEILLQPIETLFKV